MKNRLIYSLILTSTVALATNDPYFDRQWALENRGGPVKVDMDSLHTATLQGLKGFDVNVGGLKAFLETHLAYKPTAAVVDTGVDVGHPDLMKNIVPGGQDFTTLDPKSLNLNDTDGHGTNIAGIIAATSDNGIGVSGVSDFIKILPVKILPQGKGEAIPYSERLANGINFAVSKHVDAMNLSIGSPIISMSPKLRKAFQDAAAAGIIMVAASGNEGHGLTPYPCSLKQVICVGSVRADGQISIFSNQSGHVDLLAPGDNILSTYPRNDPTHQRPKHFSEYGYSVLSGTSQAAPFVTAAAALLKGMYPNITSDEVRARLYESALTRPTGRNDGLAGMLQILGALQIQPKSSVRPVFKELGDLIVGTDGTFSLTLPIKNYWAPSTSVSAEITSVNKDVHFNEVMTTLGSFKAGEEKQWVISGKLASLETESKTDFSITLHLDGKTATYSHLFNFSLDPNTFAKTTYDLPNLKASQAIYEVNTFTVLSLTSMRDEANIVRLPEYFYKTTDANGQTVTVFYRKNGQYVQKKVILPNSVSLVLLKKIHYSSEQEIGYLFRYIDKSSRTPTKIERFLYLDQDFNPKFGDHSTLTFTDLEAYKFDEDHTDVKWLRMQYGQNLIPLPVTLMTGYLPGDSGRNPFEKDPSQIRTPLLDASIHLYSLTPSWATMNLTLTPIDSHETIDQFYVQNKLTWGDTMQWMSASQVFPDHIQFSFRTQNDKNFKDWVLLVYPGLTTKFLPVDTIINLNGARQSNLLGINPANGAFSQVATVQTWFQNPYLLNFGVFNSEDPAALNSVLEFRANWQEDPTGFVLPGFMQNHVPSFFVQTGYRLVSVVPKGLTYEESSYQLYRSSLVDADANALGYQPVRIKNVDGSFSPGFFVDTTGLDIKMAYVVAIGKDGLYSPTWTAFHTIPGCAFSNPVNDEGIEKLALFCKDGDNMKLNLIPLENTHPIP